MRGDGGVAGEGRIVGVPKIHSWGKCTMPSNIPSPFCRVIEFSRHSAWYLCSHSVYNNLKVLCHFLCVSFRWSLRLLVDCAFIPKQHLLSVGSFCWTSQKLQLLSLACLLRLLIDRMKVIPVWCHIFNEAREKELERVSPVTLTKTLISNKILDVFINFESAHA